MAAILLPRFFKAFVSHFSSTSMLIPICYYEHLSPRMNKTAILQGSGGCSWKVKIARKDKKVYFGQGWEKFVEDNHLKDGEFLTFVYDGVHTFEVTIYGLDGCKETRAAMEVDTEEDLDSDSVYTLSSEDTATSVESEIEIRPKKVKTKIANPETYLEDPTNLFFETKLKNRRYELLVHSQLVKDYCLTFADRIDYIFKGEKLSAKTVNWSDQRVCINRWGHVCERINVKKDDRILCELLSAKNVVHAIKVHVICGTQV